MEKERKRKGREPGGELHAAFSRIRCFCHSENLFESSGILVCVVRILLAYGSQLLDFCLSELALENTEIINKKRHFRTHIS